MASTTLTLNAATPVLFALPGPATRVVVTPISAPAAIYVTTDGSFPTIPQAGVANPSGFFFTLGGAVGVPGSVPCPLYGDHMAIPTLRFASAGSPVIQLDW